MRASSRKDKKKIVKGKQNKKRTPSLCAWKSHQSFGISHTRLRAKEALASVVVLWLRSGGSRYLALLLLFASNPPGPCPPSSCLRLRPSGPCGCIKSSWRPGPRPPLLSSSRLLPPPPPALNSPPLPPRLLSKDGASWRDGPRSHSGGFPGGGPGGGGGTCGGPPWNEPGASGNGRRTCSSSLAPRLCPPSLTLRSSRLLLSSPRELSRPSSIAGGGALREDSSSPLRSRLGCLLPRCLGSARSS